MEGWKDGRMEGWKDGRMEEDLLEALLQRTMWRYASFKSFQPHRDTVPSVRVFPVAREVVKI
jgi:hypothetical protein